jgi:hypothetical protein
MQISGVTLYQGAPGSKFSKAPLVEVLKARVEHRICTSFLGSRACSSGNFLNLHSQKCHFLDFGERFYRILMVRKRHCNMFLLYRLNLRAPIWPIEFGGPRVLPVWAHSSYATDANITSLRVRVNKSFGKREFEWEFSQLHGLLKSRVLSFEIFSRSWLLQF